MRRAILAVLLLIASATPSVAQSPDPDWRPDRPDRLRTLDTALAPYLSQVQPLVEAIQQDFAVLSDLFRFAGIDAAAEDMRHRLEVAERLPADVQAVLTLSADALAVIDTASTEPCMEGYVAAMVTGFLSLGDTAQSLQLGDTGGSDLGVALYLLGPRGDLLHAAAVADCGSAAIA